jgi:hypothetical protein
VRIPYFIAGVALIITFGVGCSKDSNKHLYSANPPPTLTDSGTIKTQLEAIQKDYGVGIEVYGKHINIGTSGLITKNKMIQITDAIHKTFGNDFTNYTVNYIVR